MARSPYLTPKSAGTKKPVKSRPVSVKKLPLCAHSHTKKTPVSLILVQKIFNHVSQSKTAASPKFQGFQPFLIGYAPVQYLTPPHI